MKRFAITLIASTLLSIGSAQAQTILPASALYKACSAPKKPSYGLCLGFIAGLSSAALPATNAVMIALGKNSKKASNDAAAAVGKVFGCGEKYPLNETAKNFIKYVDSNPKVINLPAAYTLTSMMSHKYRCK